jgi:hypothetical protein
MNGKTYTNGRGIVVDVDVVEEVVVVAGVATVDVGAADVDGAMVTSCVALSEAHAVATTQSTISDQAVVGRTFTGDLPCVR